MEDIELDDPRVLTLAKAHQQVVHESVWHIGSAPSWEALNEAQKKAAVMEAREWLRAADRAGLLGPARAAG
ncbi:hypothetical protein ABZX75_30380 [Streptomyces sp. NPDC003038]|uniref:hypothetical protein n=1 Tax=unclassified Streptomyces TaxID=2593676 RepID=UPI0033B78C6C